MNFFFFYRNMKRKCQENFHHSIFFTYKKKKKELFDKFRTRFFFLSFLCLIIFSLVVAVLHYVFVISSVARMIKKLITVLPISQKIWVADNLPTHYAPETFKMWSEGLTLLKFDHFTATQILCEIKFWWIQTVQIVIFAKFRDSELWIFGKFGTWKLLKFAEIKIENL